MKGCRLYPLCVLGLLAACSQPTQLLVQVHSNETNLADLSLTVTALADGIQVSETAELGAQRFPVSFGIEASDSDLQASVAIQLVLARGNATVASTRRGVRGFLPNKKAYAQFCMRTDCLDTACPGTSVCGNGGCVAPDRNPQPALDDSFSCDGMSSPTDGGVSDATNDGGQTDTGGDDLGPSDTGDPIDAEPTEAGPPDFSITDVAPTDGAVPDSGMVYPWWRPDSTHRHRLRLTAPAGVMLPENSVVRVEFNNALYRSLGITDTTGVTVKVMHDGEEISRRGGVTNGFNSAGNTHVYFRMQDDLLPGQSTEDYQIYFGGIGGTAPPNPQAVPSFRTRTVNGGTQSSTSAEPASVVELTLPPARQADNWVVMALWRIRNVATSSNELADASMSIWEGNRPLPGAQALTSAQLPNGAMLGGSMIVQNGRPTGGPVMKLRFQSPSRERVEILGGRLVAFLVPEPGAPSSANNPPVIDTQATAVTVVSGLSGDNLWIARAGYRAGTTAGTNIRLESVIMQNTDLVRNLPTSMPTSVGLFQSLLNFGVVSGAGRIQVVHWAPALGAERRGVGQIAIPTGQFESVEVAGFGSPQIFTPGGTLLATLQPSDPPGGRPLSDWVYLGNAKISGTPGVLNFRLNGNLDIGAGVVLPDGAGSVVVPWAFSETTSVPSTLSARGTGTKTLGSDNGSFVALRYKDPLVFTEGLEMRP